MGWLRTCLESQSRREEPSILLGEQCPQECHLSACQLLGYIGPGYDEGRECFECPSGSTSSQLDLQGMVVLLVVMKDPLLGPEHPLF